jgi:hypothetical protein
MEAVAEPVEILLGEVADDADVLCGDIAMITPSQSSTRSSGPIVPSPTSCQCARA